MIKNIKFLILSLVALFTIALGCRKENISGIQFIPSPWIVYGSVADKEGNTYKTLAIGNKTWMVENLKTTKYNDGTPIPVIPDATYWNSLESPACCWQENNIAYKVTYGLLYNWFVIATDKLCPEGWHIPTDADWTELTDYLGGESGSAGKLKEAGIKHWNSPNNGATNETHFRALPGGNLNSADSLFQNLHEIGYWWTSSSFSSDLAVTRIMYDNSNDVEKYFYPKKNGFSVRCVWNYF